MARLNEELWKYQYNDGSLSDLSQQTIVGRYGVAPPSSIMRDTTNIDLSQFFVRQGSGGIFYKEHIDAQRVENTMWWLDQLAVRHKLYDSNHIPSNVSINSSGFEWKVHNGLEYVDFLPVKDGSGLFGYPYDDKDFWKRIRGAISHVCNNLNVVPLHDLGDYSGEYRFSDIQSTVYGSGGVWPSRWTGTVYSNLPYLVINPSGFGGPQSGIYYDSHLLGLWLPPTKENIWDSSIPSGINTAENSIRNEESKNNYGEIGQYGTLASDEYIQYFPVTGRSTLDGIFNELSITKQVSVSFGPHTQYYRVTADGDFRSFIAYLMWYRRSPEREPVGTYTYNFKNVVTIGTNFYSAPFENAQDYNAIFNYQEPILYTYEPHFNTPTMFQDNYLKEPSVWTFGNENETIFNLGYGITTTFSNYFAFVYSSDVTGPAEYWGVKEDIQYRVIAHEATVSNPVIPGEVFAFSISAGHDYYYNPSNVPYSKIVNGGAYSQHPSTMTLVTTDLSQFLNFDESVNHFRLPNYPGYQASEAYTASPFGDSISSVADFEILRRVYVPTGSDLKSYFNNNILTGGKYYKLFRSAQERGRVYTGNYFVSPGNLGYGFFGYANTGYQYYNGNWQWQTHYSAEFKDNYPLADVPGWQSTVDSLTQDKGSGEVLYGDNIPTHERWLCTIPGTLGNTLKKQIGKRNHDVVSGYYALINPHRLAADPNGCNYKFWENWDQAHGTSGNLEGGYVKYYEYQNGIYEPHQIYYLEYNSLPINGTYSYGYSRRSVYNRRETSRDEWKLLDDIPQDIESKLTQDVQTAYNSGKWVITGIGNASNYHKWTSDWVFNGNWFGNINDINNDNNQLKYTGSSASVTNGISDYFYCSVSGKYEVRQRAKILYTYVNNSSLRNKYGLYSASGLQFKGTAVFGLGDDYPYKGYADKNGDFSYIDEVGTISNGYNEYRGSIEPPQTFKIARGWVDYGSGVIDVDDIMNNISSATELYSTEGQGFVVDASGNVTLPTIAEFSIDFEEIVDERPPFDNAVFYLVYYMDPATLTLPQAKFWWNNPIDEQTFEVNEQAKGGRASVFAMSTVSGYSNMTVPYGSGAQINVNPYTIGSGTISGYNTAGFGSSTAYCRVSDGAVYNVYDGAGNVYNYTYSGYNFKVGFDDKLYRF